VTFHLRIDEVDALPFIQNLPEKSKRIVDAKIRLLAKDPFPGKGADKELLILRPGVRIYRLHISRQFTAFYRIKGDIVYITEVMTIGQAHKKYKML
jgi:mRNA-degrading endonuclease RelE of RelBE toxin-antitoxin system